MYIPTAFQVSEMRTLHQHILRYPFATLVTFSHEHGVDANHIPMLLEKDQGQYGTLTAHIARQNPLWEQYDPQRFALAIFHGPQHYIASQWYPTKQERNTAAPSWDYAVVHVKGLLEVITDEHWIKNHLNQLTHAHEKNMASPWRAENAPQEYMQAMLPNVVGLRLEIAQIIGKFKISQNEHILNRQAIIDGLQTEFPLNSGAQELAELMENDFYGYEKIKGN